MANKIICRLEINTHISKSRCYKPILHQVPPNSIQKLQVQAFCWQLSCNKCLMVVSYHSSYFFLILKVPWLSSKTKSYKYFDNDKTQQHSFLIIILWAQHASTKWLSPKIFKLVFMSWILRKFKNKLNDNENCIYLNVNCK